jgi:hypothetical protein
MTPDTTQSTTQRAADAGRTARDEAGAVGRTAADAGRQVAGTAQDQAKQVTREARRQAADLLNEARTQAGDQARAGQRRAGEGLRALAGELHGMAGGAQQQGPASDLAAQAAERVEAVASWLDQREPGELIDEVRTFARRKPGTFLLGAALAGVLVGRLTRGAVEAQRPDVAAHLPGGGGYAGPTHTTTPGFAANGPVPTGRPGYPATPPVPPAPQGMPPVPPPAPYPGPPVGAGGPPPMPPVPPGPHHTPQHAPRPGATSVGDYVEELAREPRDTGRGGPR